jgi:hypothetical protein
MSKPNWILWKQMEYLEAWQAVALSCNLNPDSLGFSSDTESIVDSKWRGFPSDEAAEEFNMRLRIAHNTSRLNNGGFRLYEFGILADKKKWAVPLEFSEAAVQSGDSFILESKAADSQASPPATVTKQSLIPGVMPRTAVGQLAIRAAWEIEQQSKRPASNNAVMSQLRKWAENADHSATLIKPDGDGVRWCTAGSEFKTFSLDSCRKTLGKWMRSRNLAGT